MKALIPIFAFLQVTYGLNLRVDFRWHDKPIPVPTTNLVTPSGETFHLTRLDLLLNQPRLTLASGRTITSSKWHAYIHGESPDILRLPNLPDEPISQLTLFLGPSEDINHADPNLHPAGHPLNPLTNNLHWSPQQGYIFFATEGQLPDDELAFAYHYGNSENRLALNFEGPLNPNGFYQLTLHLDRLFPASFKITNQTSTHSRPDDPILPHFRKTLVKAFTLIPITGSDAAPENPANASANITGTPYGFKMPQHFPLPNLPTDYPLTNERITLGQKLFFDEALSITNSVSCAFCHIPSEAFSDPAIKPWGVQPAKTTKRHSMPLLNLAWKNTPFRWDGDEPSLRTQVLRPIEDPLEMGENLATLPAKLSKLPAYPDLFSQAFGDPEITSERLAVALEQYILSLTSFDSKFDRATKGTASLTEEEKLGFQLFMTENDPRLGLRGADCFHCHSGAFFTNHRFHNNGLPPRNNDLGLEHATKRETDRFRFSTPSLRNIEITAPYMHDGRFNSLKEVVEFYSSGIHRSPTLDPNIAKHPGNGLNLTNEEQAALVAFLKTLTDPRFQAQEGESTNSSFNQKSY
ncbi:MAG: MbnP family protein [Verrucomicrobiota bacterium]